MDMVPSRNPEGRRECRAGAPGPVPAREDARLLHAPQREHFFFPTPRLAPGSHAAGSPHAARLAEVFCDSLATAREAGAPPAALVTRLLPLVRLASVHGTPRELAVHVRELFSLREPRSEARAVLERLARSLTASGRRAAAQRLRSVQNFIAST